MTQVVKKDAIHRVAQPLAVAATDGTRSGDHQESRTLD
jgi:hypothetical protein